MSARRLVHVNGSYFRTHIGASCNQALAVIVALRGDYLNHKPQTLCVGARVEADINCPWGKAIK